MAVSRPNAGAGNCVSLTCRVCHAGGAAGGCCACGHPGIARPEYDAAGPVSGSAGLRCRHPTQVRRACMQLGGTLRRTFPMTCGYQMCSLRPCLLADDRSRQDATPQQLREAAKLLRAASGVRIAATLPSRQDDGRERSAGEAARLQQGQARIVEFADEPASFNPAIGELGKAFLKGEAACVDSCASCWHAVSTGLIGVRGRPCRHAWAAATRIWIRAILAWLASL